MESAEKWCNIWAIMCTDNTNVETIGQVVKNTSELEMTHQGKSEWENYSRA